MLNERDLKYEKPFVVLRALSDKADGNIHYSYENAFFFRNRS